VLRRGNWQHIVLSLRRFETRVSRTGAFEDFSGLVGADRWRVSEWRLAAQQQCKRAQARHCAWRAEQKAANGIHWVESSTADVPGARLCSWNTPPLPTLSSIKPL